MQAAVTVLEDDPLFNAGRGAVLSADGSVELDAAIMDGSDLRAGAVPGVRHVRNPVQLARRVLEDCTARVPGRRRRRELRAPGRLGLVSTMIISSRPIGCSSSQR